MNLQLRFLQKAIEDKNYVKFNYEDKSFKRLKPLKLINKDGLDILHSDVGEFDFSKVKNFTVLKDRF